MSQTRPIIVYDADCGICQRTLAFVQRMDWLGALDSAPFHEAIDLYPEALEGGIDRGVRVRFADRSVMVGIDAVRSIAIRTPLGALVAWMLWIPPIRALARRLYDHVAAHRQSTCRLRSG